MYQGLLTYSNNHPLQWVKTSNTGAKWSGTIIYRSPQTALQSCREPRRRKITKHISGGISDMTHAPPPMTYRRGLHRCSLLQPTHGTIKAWANSLQICTGIFAAIMSPLKNGLYMTARYGKRTREQCKFLSVLKSLRMPCLFTVPQSRTSGRKRTISRKYQTMDSYATGKQ